jgi:hypothetical protein
MEIEPDKLFIESNSKRLKNHFFVTLCLLGLVACGGGSSGSSPTPPVVTPVPDPPIVDGIADPIFPPNYNVTSCAGFDYLKAISIESDNASTNGLESSNVIDNSLDATSRWETDENAAEITIELGYRHLVKEIATAWFEGDQSTTSFDLALSEDGGTYTTILTSEQTSGITESFEHFDIADTVARFVRITSYGRNSSNTTALLEAAVFGCPLDVETAPLENQTVDLNQFNLDPNAPPGDNFDLLTWALDTPREDPSDGFSQRTSERDLNDGFEDPDHFYTGPDGGMVFRSTIYGVATSANTSFNRSELREMLRRGNTSISTTGVNQNNWILDYQPDPGRAVGGRGGLLSATLRVDHVTTTGSQQHQGRVVIGQIHADDDEPIRLYYKKYPNNERGYIYFGHEIRTSDDIWLVVVGPNHDNEDNQPLYTANPEQGIALGEIFSYEIIQKGPRIDVIIRRGDLSGPIIGHQFVDMNEENSGYDIPQEWMYFKAGAYSQNNTGESGDANGEGTDYEKITFFSLSNTH